MQFFFELISGRKKGLFATLLRAGLWALSLLFGVIVYVRRWLFLCGIRKSYRSPLLTISVGNITAGGTGKTPFTIYLAEKISLKVAILLRGYKSKAESGKTPLVILGSKNLDFRQVGDEACIISRRLPEVPVYVGKKRAQSARLAEKNGAKCLILDDGMQHYSLQRDIEIVVIDVKNPFGYGYLLPRGLLREPLSALKRADLIVLNRADCIVESRAVEKKIAHFTSAPIIKTVLVFDGIYDYEGKEQTVEHKKVGLFCGIGNPQAFRELVERFGFDVVEILFLQDHEPLDQDGFEHFSKECQKKQASALLCTEKDIVKFFPSPSLTTLPLYWVRVQLKILEGEDAFNEFAARVQREVRLR